MALQVHGWSKIFRNMNKGLEISKIKNKQFKNISEKKSKKN